MWIPPAKLLSQGEAIPHPIMQIHVQEIDAPAVILHRFQERPGGGCGANHLHVVVFYKNFPLKSGLNLVADGFLVVAQVNWNHFRPPMVSSWTNTPPAQFVAAVALGQSIRIR